jgi:hypothetical protein
VKLLHNDGEGREVWLTGDEALTRVETRQWVIIHGVARGETEGVTIKWYAPGSQQAINNGAYTGRRWKQLEAQRLGVMNDTKFMPYIVTTENVCQGNHWSHGDYKTARDHFVSESLKEMSNPEQGQRFGIFVELDNYQNLPEAKLELVKP